MNMKQDCLVLLGAVIGGLLGYVVFFWLAHQGFYGLVVPGGLLGIGAGLIPCSRGSISPWHLIDDD